ncbi:hypothetical protein BIW11_07257, partial [Tropilaelaps mercedesae]
MSHQQPPRAPPAPLSGSPGPPPLSDNSPSKQQSQPTTSKQQSSALTGSGSITSSSSSFRCPPGWTRFVSGQGHIIYRTALGHEIHNAKQLRDFLLSDVTCKCGLPCPLVIDKWFDFSSSSAN